MVGTPGLVGTSWDVYAAGFRAPGGGVNDGDGEASGTVADFVSLSPSSARGERFVTPPSALPSTDSVGTGSVASSRNGGGSSTATGRDAQLSQIPKVRILLQRKMSRTRSRIPYGARDDDDGFESFGTPGSTPRSSASEQHFDLARAMDELDESNAADAAAAASASLGGFGDGGGGGPGATGEGVGVAAGHLFDGFHAKKRGPGEAGKAAGFGVGGGETPTVPAWALGGFGSGRARERRG